MGVVEESVILLKSANAAKSIVVRALSLKASASVPTAVLSVPSVLNNIAAAPTATLSAALLKASVPAPTPVLKKASLLIKSENQPIAVLNPPVQGGKGVLPLPGVATAKVSFLCLRSGRKPKAGKHGQDDYECCAAIFHYLNFPFVVLAFSDFPGALSTRHPPGERVTMPFHVQPVYLFPSESVLPKPRCCVKKKI